MFVIRHPELSKISVVYPSVLCIVVNVDDGDISVPVNVGLFIFDFKFIFESIVGLSYV